MSLVEQRRITGENHAPELRTEIRSSAGSCTILDPDHLGRGAWCRDSGIRRAPLSTEVGRRNTCQS
ncbi:hypothetical protein U1Q18_025893, partial [Sarracenia purpurea var. burkii]